MKFISVFKLTGLGVVCITIITRPGVFICLFHRMKNYLLNVTTNSLGLLYTKNEITLRILEGMALNYPSCCIFSMASKYRRQKWDRKGDCLERKIIKKGA